MTSEKSLLKLLVLNLKNRAYIGILSLTIFIISFPVRFLFVMQSDANTYGQVNSHWYSHGCVLYMTRQLTRPSATPIVMLTIFAFLAALSGYIYLHSTASEDFYHAIPVKRSVIFRERYLSGFLLVIVPFVLSYLAGMYVVISGSQIKIKLAPSMLLNMLGMIMVFLSVYSCIVFSCIISGRALIAFLTSAVFMSIIPGSYVLFIFLVTSFFSHVGDISNDVFVKVFPYSPLLAILSFGNSGKGAILCLIYALVFTALAILIYKKRPSESAGMPYSWEFIKTIVKIAVLIPSSMLGGSIVYWIAESEINAARAWFIFATVVFVLLFGYIIDMIFNMSARLQKRACISTLIALAVNLIIMVGLIYDPFRIDTYVPQESKLSSIGIYSESDTAYQGRRYYMGFSQPDKADKARIKDFEPILSLINETIDEERNSDRAKTNRYTSYEYTTSVCVCYELKTGKKIYRYYDVDSTKYDELLTILTRDKKYRDNTYILQKDLSKVYNEISISGFDNSYIEESTNIPLIGKEFARFSDCIKEDSRSMTYQDFKKSTPLYEVQLLGNGSPSDYADELGGDLADTIYIYPEYKKTLAFLEEKTTNLPVKTDISSRIERAEIAGEMTETSVTVTNKNSIQKLLSCTKKVPYDIPDKPGRLSILYYYHDGSTYDGLYEITDQDMFNEVLNPSDDTEELETNAE